MNGVDASVLFDSGASHTFVSPSLVEKLGLHASELSDFLVTLPSKDRVSCTRYYQGAVIRIRDEDFPINMIEFKGLGFDVIVGMNWLQKFRGRILCAEHHLLLRSPSGTTVSYRQRPREPSVRVISAMSMYRELRRQKEVFLCYVQDTSRDPKFDTSIPVVSEFPDLFPEELPGMPPEREVQFTIDLLPGTGPIAKAPYRMAPAEMAELKEQLRDLLDKGFIRPSV